MVNSKHYNYKGRNQIELKGNVLSIFGHMFLENYLFHNKGEDCMNQDKIEIQHINYLRSTLNLRLSMIDDWTPQQNVIEIVGDVIEAYCMLIGKKNLFLSRNFRL